MSSGHMSIHSRFLVIITGILLLSTCLLSVVIVTNEAKMLHGALRSKGKSLASYIAKLSRDPLIMGDVVQLDAIVNEMIKEQDVLYAFVKDESGAFVTSQYASVNYASPLLMPILEKVPRESELGEIINRIKQAGGSETIETTMPITADNVTIHGTVTIGLSRYPINQRLKKTVLFVVGVNGAVALLLGWSFFGASKRILLNPMSDMAAAAARLAEGDLAARVGATSTGEMQHLLDAFNIMAEKLQKTTVSKDLVDCIITSINEALIVVSAELAITDINAAAARLLGYGKEELVGRRLDVVIDPLVFAAGCEMEEGLLCNCETVLRGKGGKPIPVFFSASMIRSPEQSMSGMMVCTAYDLSEIKEANRELALQAEELARSNEELQKFAFIASHDLQEPLRKVTAFGDRLQEKYGDVLGEQGGDYLARMQNAAMRMQTLINDLLAFSRITTKAQPFVELDLRDVVQKVVADLEGRLVQTGGQVVVGELPFIEADPLQMRQLFQNLIGNSLKFHRQDAPPLVTITGSVIMDRRGAGGRELCHLSVLDNGIGFDQKYNDRIFEVFQRLHGRSEYEGTGIGLAICRKIAERHGGSITARSTPGEGAEFIVQLPVRQAKAPEAFTRYASI